MTGHAHSHSNAHSHSHAHTDPATARIVAALGPESEGMPDLGIPAADRLALVEAVLSADGATGASPDAATARWRNQFDAVMARVRATPACA